MSCTFPLEEEPLWGDFIQSPWERFTLLRLDCQRRPMGEGDHIDIASDPALLHLGVETCALVRDGAAHRLDLLYACVNPF